MTWYLAATTKLEASWLDLEYPGWIAAGDAQACREALGCQQRLWE